MVGDGHTHLDLTKALLQISLPKFQSQIEYASSSSENAVQILPQNSQFLILSTWPASSSVDVPRKHVQTLGRMQGQVNILPKAAEKRLELQTFTLVLIFIDLHRNYQRTSLILEEEKQSNGDFQRNCFRWKAAINWVCVKASFNLKRKYPPHNMTS